MHHLICLEELGVSVLDHGTWLADVGLLVVDLAVFKFLTFLFFWFDVWRGK